VENKPGAGAVLGTDIVAKAAPDGYTFLISAAGVVSNSMIRKVPYKDSDLVPVAMIGLAPSVIIVPANSPYKDLKDFVAQSKKGAGLHFSTAGVGSTPHFVEGLLTTKYGAKLDLVPYKSGGESVAAVMGNQVDATSEASIVVLPSIKGGKQRAPPPGRTASRPIRNCRPRWNRASRTSRSPTGPACMRRRARRPRSSTRWPPPSTMR
jgi:tripartite-type tricarboxylate transporter receptor subunit TctC